MAFPQQLPHVFYPAERRGTSPPVLTYPKFAEPGCERTSVHVARAME